MYIFKIKSTSIKSISLYKDYIRLILKKHNLKCNDVHFPSKMHNVALLKSPHVNKKAKEHFELKTFRTNMSVAVNSFEDMPNFSLLVLNKPLVVSLSVFFCETEKSMDIKNIISKDIKNIDSMNINNIITNYIKKKKISYIKNIISKKMKNISNKNIPKKVNIKKKISTNIKKKASTNIKKKVSTNIKKKVNIKKKISKDTKKKVSTNKKKKIKTYAKNL